MMDKLRHFWYTMPDWMCSTLEILRAIAIVVSPVLLACALAFAFLAAAGHPVF